MKTTTKKKTVFSVDYKVVPDYRALADIVRGLRAQRKKIVLTLGVFDMIHEGHVRYIELAKSHGDVLVLGVDDDALTRRNKGPDRPFDKLNERVNVLAALQAVDFIKVQGLRGPKNQIVEVVRPDVMIISLSSSQYDKDSRAYVARMRKTFEKSGLVGKIVALEPQSSNSTSAKLRTLKADGMNELGQDIMKLIEERLTANGKGHD